MGKHSTPSVPASVKGALCRSDNATGHWSKHAAMAALPGPEPAGEITIVTILGNNNNSSNSHNQHVKNKTEKTKD